MSHKINPNAYRIGVNKGWTSRWFATDPKTAGQLLRDDIAIREMVRKMVNQAGIDKIDIERNSSTCRVTVKVTKPGLVIGRGGKGIEDLTKAIELSLAKNRANRTNKAAPRLSVNVEEVKRTDVSATVTAQQIAWDLEKRMPYRRTIKRYLGLVMQNRDVQGVKIKVGGRLDGNEIARKEWLAKGKLPLTTLRANIDYGIATAFTTYGAIGVKVWIYKGEVA
ncbi:MAG: 30S ribosomal protein S3 [Patescibacteria group bacterium]|nr:30S ribosomal protein S3 [Patescibacteria group bacterium]